MGRSISLTKAARKRGLEENTKGGGRVQIEGFGVFERRGFVPQRALRARRKKGSCIRRFPQMGADFGRGSFLIHAKTQRRQGFHLRAR
jgi:hypothetical protein